MKCESKSRQIGMTAEKYFEQLRNYRRQIENAKSKEEAEAIRAKARQLKWQFNSTFGALNVGNRT